MRWEVTPESLKENADYFLKNGVFLPWITLRGTDGERADDGLGRELWTWKAWCKLGGCIELSHYFNGYEYNTPEDDQNALYLEDSIHICDLRQFVTLLYELHKTLEENRFG
jgi:hypothetical protein